MPKRENLPVVLWLASWYPCKLDAFNGDFVQRAARALSQRMPVHVFYLMKDEKGELTKSHLEETTQTGHLTETRLYYHPFKTGITAIDKLISAIRYTGLGRNWLKQFKQDQVRGRPLIVEVGVAMRAGTLALWMKRKWGQPYLVQEHWTGYYRYLMPKEMQKSLFFWKMLHRILEKADVLLPDSRHLGEWINKEMLPIRFTEIPNAVDTSLFYFKNYEENHKVFRFIHVSTLGYQKNTDGILRAFLQLVIVNPNFNIELEIVGPNFEQHLPFVEANGNLNEKVRFVGPLPYQLVAKHMRKAHAMVLFSRYENLPCVMLEAFCCGLPVIATRVGGIEYHLPTTHGILIDSENEEQLFKAMENVYSLYEKFNRKAISENASARYGLEPVGVLYEKTYSEVYPHLFSKTEHLVG